MLKAPHAGTLGHGSRFEPTPLRQFDLQQNAVLLPQERHSHQPIFLLQQPPRLARRISFKKPRSPGKLWACDSAANRARRQFHGRCVSHPFHFARFRVRENINLSILLREPYRSSHSLSRLSKRCQRYVFLIGQFRSNLNRHPAILRLPSCSVRAARRLSGPIQRHCPKLSRCVTSHSCANGCASA